MTREAPFYVSYYVIVRYTQATIQDQAFIQDWPKYEAIRYICFYRFKVLIYLLMFINKYNFLVQTTCIQKLY